MDFKDWKIECKRLIYEQEENSEEGVAINNLAFVDGWIDQFEMDYTPKEAVHEANMDAIEQSE